MRVVTKKSECKKLPEQVVVKSPKDAIRCMQGAVLPRPNALIVPLLPPGHITDLGLAGAFI